MKFLTISLCTFWLFFAGAGHAQTPSKNRGLGDIFASMLKESMENADLVAHVEVTGFQYEKKSGEPTLFRVESRMLESFKGPFVEALVFSQEAEKDFRDEDFKDDVTGSRIIVTLRKNEQDGQYYVSKNGHSFPESENLLSVARKLANSEPQE